MGFADFLQGIAQRVAQNTQATQAGQVAGHDVGNIPVLGGILTAGGNPNGLSPVNYLNSAGMVQDGMGTIAKALAGELALAAAAPQARFGDPNNSATQASQAALSQGFAHPGRAIDVIRHGPDTGMALLGGGLELAANPLNYAGGMGQAGTALHAAEDAPAALRALGGALEAASLTGRASMLPYEAGFSAIGRGVKPVVGPLLAALRGAAPAVEDTTPALLKEAVPALESALQTAAPAAPLAPAFSRATLGAIAKSGIDPAKLAGLDDDLARYVAENAGPGQEDGLIAALRGVEPAPSAAASTSTPLDELRQAATFSDDPAVAKVARDKLAALETPPAETPLLPTTPEAGQLPLPETGAPRDIPQQISVSPAASTPVTPEPPALDFTDRAGVVKAVANAPLDHLNNVLRDLHNAVYPGQQSDFAIPALTGQAKQAFRTSFLTDHPGGNAAEPYLDYLISRVQKDPKAAARLADLNPLLADDVNLLAESDLPLAEHKRLVQSLFGAGPFAGTETPPPDLPALSGQPGAQAGTLDDLRALVTGGDGGKMGGYAPSDPAFYAKRLGIAPGDVPGMLDQLVQEGTLGRLPDGSLGIKPAPPAGMTPAERADWQARYVGQSQAGTDILAAGDKVAGSDLTQADLNALSPQERMAALRKLAGGFADAAGGGGFGLLPARLGSTLAGAGVGTGLGGAAGGGIGYLSGHRDDQLKQDIAAGAGLGALAGGSAGSVAPELADILGPNLLDPLRAVHTEGVASFRQAIATGEKNPIPSMSKALPYIRSIKKTSAMTLPRNVVGALSTVGIGGGSPAEAARNALEIWRNLPTLLPELRAAGSDATARNEALLQALPAAMQTYDHAGLRDLVEAAGVNYERNPTDLGAANVHPLAGAVRGAALGLATPKTLVFGPATAALGAAEGASLPYRAAAQTALLTPIDQGARLSFAFPDYARTLGEAAPAFLKRVAATGQDVSALDTAGRFAATDIADPALASEWRAIQQRAAQAGGALAKDKLGNFSDTGASQGIINALFPGGSWNVEQAKVLARAAARNPVAAVQAIRLIETDYQNHVQSGDPQHAGTWHLTDQTPGLGLLVRAANGGAPGDLYVNPLYPISPVGGDILNLPRELDTRLHPGMKPYDQATTIAGTLGLGVNPEIALGAYKSGASDTAPGSQVRLAPVGAFADALLHEHGAPLWSNPIGQALTPDALQTPDLDQQIKYGRYLDPAAITAGNEMIYEQRHTSSSDPKNADLVSQLRDPASPFYHEALLRGLGGKAATAALGDVVPGSPQAQTATAGQGAAARFALLQGGLPLTLAQKQAIAADPQLGGPVRSQALTAALDAAKLQNPVLAVQDVSSPQALGQKVFDQWQRDHAGLALFPSVYGVQGAQEQERLGLVPLGTAAAAQQHLDQLLSGQAYGRPELYPGVAPMPYDPTPILDLMRYLNGGR